MTRFPAARVPVCLAVLTLLVLGGVPGRPSGVAQIPTATRQAAGPAAQPAARLMSVREPVLATATATASAAHYAFISRAGHPAAPIARWNPCSGPIGYRVNLARAPRGALADVQGAVERISAATGLRFRYLGTTSVVPSSTDSGPAYPAGTSIVVAWARPGQSRMLPEARSGAARPLAMGGGSWVTGRVDARGRVWGQFVEGAVVVDATQYPEPGFGRAQRGTRGRMLMHELGHVVGLGHVGDPAQVMYPVDSGAAVWGAGDRTGLRVLGAASGCLYAPR